MCQSQRLDGKRSGFTLIELLVVMAIMAFLATVAVLMLPRLNENQRAGRGADQLQGWLLIAKQRALRSGLPSGLRFVEEDPKNPTNFMTECLYVEQPPDFVLYWPDPTSTATPPPQVVRPLIIDTSTSTPRALLQTVTSIKIGQFDFTGGDATGQQPSAWPVQPGDFLELQGGGLLHQITVVTNDTLTLASAPLNVPPTTGIQTWRIIRGTRVLQGEEPLKLPNNVGIFKGIVDASGNVLMPGTKVGTLQGKGGNALEIIFAPSGRVLTPNVDPIFLWLADETADDPSRQNDPVILSIKAATGFIANYPVDVTYSAATVGPPYTPPGNPYIFAQSNRSGGL